MENMLQRISLPWLMVYGLIVLICIMWFLNRSAGTFARLFESLAKILPFHKATAEHINCFMNTELLTGFFILVVFFRFKHMLSSFWHIFSLIILFITVCFVNAYQVRSYQKINFRKN